MLRSITEILIKLSNGTNYEFLVGIKSIYEHNVNDLPREITIFTQLQEIPLDNYEIDIEKFLRILKSAKKYSENFEFYFTYVANTEYLNIRSPPDQEKFKENLTELSLSAYGFSKNFTMKFNTSLFESTLKSMKKIKNQALLYIADGGPAKIIIEDWEDEIITYIIQDLK